MALNLHNSSGKGRMWSRAAGQAGGMGDYVLFSVQILFSEPARLFSPEDCEFLCRNRRRGLPGTRLVTGPTEGKGILGR